MILTNNQHLKHLKCIFLDLNFIVISAVDDSKPQQVNLKLTAGWIPKHMHGLWLCGRAGMSFNLVHVHVSS